MAEVKQSLQDFYYEWIYPAWDWMSGTSVEAIPIYQSVQARLDNLNYHLSDTQHVYRRAANDYDNAKRDTASQEAIYNACNTQVEDRLEEIKGSMLKFCDKVGSIGEALTDAEDEETILKMMNKLVNCISKLKKPNNLEKAYEWVDPIEYWSLHDYQQAVSRRDEAENELKKCKRRERPFLHRLEDVKEKMENIEKEKETLSEFSTKYKEGYVRLTSQDPPPPYEEGPLDDDIIKMRDEMKANVDNYIAPTYSNSELQPPIAHTSPYGLTYDQS